MGLAADLQEAYVQGISARSVDDLVAYATKGQRQMVVALINTIFAQESAEAAHTQWRVVIDQLRDKFPRLANMVDGAEQEVLPYLVFPSSERSIG